MLRLLLTIFGVGLLAAGSLLFFATGLMVIGNAVHWWQVVIGTLISSLSIASLLWGGEAIASYSFPSQPSTVAGAQSPANDGEKVLN